MSVREGRDRLSAFLERNPDARRYFGGKMVQVAILGIMLGIAIGIIIAGDCP